MRYLLPVLISCFFYSILTGNPVTIIGLEPAYAGTEFSLLKYSDQISGSEASLAKTLIAEDGSFSVSFDIDETEFVFAYLGIYKVHLFAEPGQSYRILLPPKQEKATGDFLNPYFSPVTVHLATAEYQKDELNTLIRMFNDAFLPFYNKHILTITTQTDFSELDLNIEQMEKPFSGSENQYFNDYRRYKYGLLRHLATQQRSRSVSDEYFKGKPVRINNTSYMELFNQVYDRYLHHIAGTHEGDRIGKAVKSENFDSLRIVIAPDKMMGEGNLPDLILLKSIYDEFYDDNYSRSALLGLLDDYIRKSSDTGMRELAGSIRSKVTRLLVGFAPPDFELYDRDSTLVKLSDFRGKYVYINFCSCFSYTCMNEFKMLSSIYEKHSGLIEIVTILIDNDPDVINGFLDRSHYQWKFLHYGYHSEIIREYDIRAFPTYFLIDREGKLAISPAPSPGEEFESRFFKLMRSKGEI
jgi:peroxiredoxin